MSSASDSDSEKGPSPGPAQGRFLRRTESSASSVCSDAEVPITLELILDLLSSKRKLDRDRGIVKLEKLIKKWESGEIGDDEAAHDRRKLKSETLKVLLSDDAPVPAATEGSEIGTSSRTESPSGNIIIQTPPGTVSWERKHGHLMACYPIIASSNPKCSEDQHFMKKVQEITIQLIRNPEIKIQIAAGGVLGFMSKYAGPSVYVAAKDIILELISKNLNAAHTIVSPEDELKSVEQGFDINIPASLIHEKVIRESLGWKDLEPSLKCLQFMIENLDSDFVPFIDGQVMGLIIRCLSHNTRFVREVGFQIIGVLIPVAPDEIRQYGHTIARHLSEGLSDNWNQVRIAAAIASRKFMMAYKESKHEFFPVLLPQLCLNRYYKADGVRMYSQESWKLIVGSEGRHLVGQYIKDVVPCYLLASNSSNLAERESVCSCISELATKIDRGAIEPYTIQLLDALLVNCENESWSVRDAASLAVGNFIASYPQESKPYLDKLYTILFKNLEDPVPLLRQGAASALANIVYAYGTEAQAKVIEHITNGLTNQVEKLKAHADPDSGTSSPTGSGSSSPTKLYPAEENACMQHTPHCEFALPGKIEVSSETLHQIIQIGEKKIVTLPAPCVGCRKSKQPQPWHLVDGCLYAIGALSELPECKSELSPLIPLMVTVSQVRTYKDHLVIHETFCKIIPAVAKGIGKKPFKEFLSSLFEPIFYSVECENPMISSAGKNCLSFLAEFLGPNILKSRVEMYDPRFVHLVEPEMPHY